MSHQEQLYRLSQAADRLQISLSMLKRLRRDGKVRVVKVGRRAVRITGREISRLCALEE
jgi:excisionase family DNA binding protein